MESPPSFSTHSEAPPLSEDSGLLITSGSFSSDSASGWHHVASELQESDFDERSLSPGESTDTSERMSGDFFNTVKKGPAKVLLTTIDPPPEFQDSPVVISKEKYTAVVTPPSELFSDTLKNPIPTSLMNRHVSPVYPRRLKVETLHEHRQCMNLNHRFASPHLLHLSPGRSNRPSSRSSFSSRLSSSHNSLVTQFQTDDSSFITQAISHDTLTSKPCHITDMYNVPVDSDIYAVPIDSLRPNPTNVKCKVKKPRTKKRGKSTPLSIGANYVPPERSSKCKEPSKHKDGKTKRNSLPSSSCKKNYSDPDTDTLHLTLREMRKYLHTLYSSSSESECRNTIKNKTMNSSVTNVGVHTRQPSKGTAVFLTESTEVTRPAETNNNIKKGSKHPFCILPKSKKRKENIISSTEIIEIDINEKVVKNVVSSPRPKVKISSMRILSINLKQSFCNLFRWRRSVSEEGVVGVERVIGVRAGGSPPAAVRRALPPLPPSPRAATSSRRVTNDDDTALHFATSIQIVKDYGWYWGPLSVEAAEKILSNEPDGSFIVRDSSDDHYIFTLTFKLNGLRHVRIEHDQGNFCFGGCTMFKAATIVEFIENAVETSRSGRYLFFLNLRPVLGPVRVQLLYPVSRFKRVQSLQHMCRFVILKYVRRDLIGELPLPRRLLDYLSATHYYSELLADI